MADFKDLKAIMDYIIEKDPDVLADKYAWVAAEHDVIYLPIPNDVSEEELQQKGEELGFGIEEDSIRVFV